jgi:hypothetical protein
MSFSTYLKNNENYKNILEHFGIALGKHFGTCQFKGSQMCWNCTRKTLELQSVATGTYNISDFQLQALEQTVTISHITIRCNTYLQYLRFSIIGIGTNCYNISDYNADDGFTLRSS